MPGLEPLECFIDGAMFLRNCDREEALAWLSREPTEAEYQETEPHIRDIHPGKSPAEVRDFTRRYILASRGWKAALAKNFTKN